MSWNPRKLFATTKPIGTQGFCPIQDDVELDKYFTELNNTIEASKKLHKNAKKFTDCSYALAKCEQKLTQDFSTSSLCHYDDDLREIIESYHSVTSEITPVVDEMIGISQRAVVEPMKKLNVTFASVNVALKKRECLIQECQKYQLKVEKTQEKERTGANIAKLEVNKKALATAKSELASHNQMLLQEFPILLAARTEYFQPCLEALIRTEVNHYGEYTRLFNDLIRRSDIVNTIPDNAYNSTLQQRLSDIKSLSIVAND